jgi:hypothetical protein
MNKRVVAALALTSLLLVLGGLWFILQPVIADVARGIAEGRPVGSVAVFPDGSGIAVADHGPEIRVLRLPDGTRPGPSGVPGRRPQGGFKDGL